MAVKQMNRINYKMPRKKESGVSPDETISPLAMKVVFLPTPPAPPYPPHGPLPTFQSVRYISRRTK